MKLKINVLLLSLLLLISTFASANKQYNTDCLKFDKKNYLSILDKGESGVYTNPFSDGECFALSFSDHDYFETNILLTTNKKILLGFDLFKIKTGLDVAQLYDENKKQIYKFMKFHKMGTQIEQYGKIMKYFKSINPVYLEYFYLHEIFHLNIIIAKDDNYKYKYEVYSDISSIMFLRDKYSLNEIDTIAIIKDIERLRTTTFNIGNRGSIYNDMYGDFIDYIKINGVSDISASSFVDVYQNTLKLFGRYK